MRASDWSFPIGLVRVPWSNSGAPGCGRAWSSKEWRTDGTSAFGLIRPNAALYSHMTWKAQRASIGWSGWPNSKNGTAFVRLGTCRWRSTRSIGNASSGCARGASNSAPMGCATTAACSAAGAILPSSHRYRAARRRTPPARLPLAFDAARSASNRHHGFRLRLQFR